MPRIAPDPFWNAGKIADLTELWEAGVTTSEIGRRLGTTKMAVIGKVHRIGLTPRILTERPPRLPTALELVQPNGCRWGLGHPTDPEFRFCGEQVSASRPYCESHCARAYVKA